MKRSGFSLIEIIIAMFISSLLAMVLYRVFFQTNRVVSHLISTIELQSDMLPVYTQMSKDFAGMLVLPQEAQKKSSPTAGSSTPVSPTQVSPTPGSKNQAAQTQQPAEQADQETAHSKRKPPFIGTLKDGRFENMSFVTTNAFAAVDEPKISLVRVNYHLVAEPNEQFFTLVREESPYEPEEKSKKAVRAYPLLYHLRDVLVTYHTYQHKDGSIEEVAASKEWKPQPEEPTAEPRQESSGRISMAGQQQATIKQTSSVAAKKLPTIPQSIHIAGTIFQTTQSNARSRPFSFQFSCGSSGCHRADAAPSDAQGMDMPSAKQPAKQDANKKERAADQKQTGTAGQSQGMVSSLVQSKKATTQPQPQRGWNWLKGGPR